LQHSIAADEMIDREVRVRIVFLGSPAEVIPPLELLADGKCGAHTLVAVVTQPARPAGRGGRAVDPPVAAWAKARGIPVLQPESARDREFLDGLRHLEPDVAVTAAYGQILNKEFLSIPTRATINIHPSLLPAWRGATPVPAALLDGATVTGVSVLFTVRKLDAGDIILQREVAIGPDETSGELTARLFVLGGEMLADALARLEDSWFGGTPQDPARVSLCGKIDKNDGLIDWRRSAADIHNRFRAFSPWPGSFTFLEDRRLVVTGMKRLTSASGARVGSQPGSVGFDRAARALIVRCGTIGDELIGITGIKPSGGKDIDAPSFWNGVRNKENAVFVAGGQES